MGWLFYTMLLVCCFSAGADEAPTRAELNDLRKRLEKVESDLGIADRLVQIKNTPTPTGKDCQEVYANGGTTSGVYTITPGGKNTVQVYCEQELQGGGWTVVQRRVDGSIDFYRDWAEYKRGFGNASSEYWVGNDNLHLLTADGNQQLLVELLDYIGDWGETYRVQYSQFLIKDEAHKFELEIGGFTQVQNYPGDSMAYHNGRPFSTRDADHDSTSTVHCAQYLSGGWWYGDCADSNLNGEYSPSIYYKGIWWRDWTKYHSMAAVRMMIKAN